MVDRGSSSDSTGAPTRRSVLRAAGTGALGSLVVGAGGGAASLEEPLDSHDPRRDVPFTCHDSERNYAEVSDEGPYDIEDAEETVVELPSAQDDEVIQIGIVRPDPEAVDDAPVIVRATPYVDDLHDVDIAECWGVKRLAYNFVPHGYAVAVMPVRGTGGAGGCMTLFGPAERRDLDQAITYLGEADWSNGNVGMSGGSYDGTTPFEVAGMGNPHAGDPGADCPERPVLRHLAGGTQPRHGDPGRHLRRPRGL